MLYISNATLLTITAVLDIAIYGGDKPVTGEMIRGRLHLPHRALDEILQVLAHSGILTSTRGVQGGYRLAREPRKISIEDILRASGTVNTRNEELDDPEAILARAAVAHALALAGVELTRQLRKITLADLMRRCAEGDAEVRSNKEKGLSARPPRKAMKSIRK